MFRLSRVARIMHADTFIVTSYVSIIFNQTIAIDKITISNNFTGQQRPSTIGQKSLVKVIVVQWSRTKTFREKLRM